MKKQKWIRRPPSTKRLQKQEARIVENLNAAKDQTETASHSRECCDVLVLLTDHKEEVVTVCELIDSGCTRSIMLKNYVEKKRLKRSGRLKNPVEYQTYGRVFKARKKARADFVLPGISTTRKVEWEFMVDEL